MGRTVTAVIIALLIVSLSLNILNFYSNQHIQQEVSDLNLKYEGLSSAIKTLKSKISELASKPPSPPPETQPQKATPKPGGELTPQEVFELAEKSVVQIITRVPTLFGFEETQGSGFIYSSEGYIITNNHVVEGAVKIEVRFVDGSAYEAKIVGLDPYSDLAVLKIEAKGVEFKPLKLGDSSKLRVGDVVVAIGNPFGLSGTMTLGIVSQLGRALPAPGGYLIVDVIQTDAAINPGNSGGPLLNLKGEVVGVNTAIVSPTGAFAGVGFAIPSNTVKIVVPELIAKGHYYHPWIGVKGVDVTPRLAEALGLPVSRGFLVVEAIPRGPADKAGIRGGSKRVVIDNMPLKVGGDIIIGIDNVDIRGRIDILLYLERNVRVGETVTLKIIRDGETLNVDVKVGPRPPP